MGIFCPVEDLPLSPFTCFPGACVQKQGVLRPKGASPAGGGLVLCWAGGQESSFRGREARMGGLGPK